VSLYTLVEKINATSSGSPGVERLGIPPYQWWSKYHTPSKLLTERTLTSISRRGITRSGGTVH
jgi:hypothetical protein